MSGKSYEQAVVSVKSAAPERSYNKAVIPVGNDKGGDGRVDPHYLMEAAEDFAVAIPKGAMNGFTDEAASLISPEAGQAVDERQKLGEERSPIATFAGEAVGEQINPLTKAGSLRKNILNTMSRVVGNSDDKLSKETVVASGAAGLVDVGVDIALKNAKIPFSNDSKTLRARVAGASTTEFKDIGINDRERIAEDLHKLGFFQGKPVEFNLQTLKFEPSKAKAGIIQKPTSQILMDRTDDALEKLHTETRYILTGANKNKAVQIPEADVVETIEKTLAEFQGGLVGDPQGREKLEQIAEHLYEELFHVRKGSGITGSQILAGVPIPQATMDVEKFYSFKRNLQDMSRAYGKNPQLKQVTNQDDFYRGLAYKMGEILSTHIPDKRLRDIGMKQHDLLVVTKDLANKIARQKATGLVNPPSLLQGRQGSFYAQKFLESLPMGSTDEGLLLRATAQDVGNYVQEKAPQAVDYARQLMEGLPKELGQSMAQPTQGRSPQSVPNIPEMLLKVKIPRTSEGVLKNKEVVLAKVAQQDPTFYPILKEFIEERPDELGDLLPKLIATTPAAFERDPYNRVDNKVMDQASKLKAINDTMRRNDMTNTEKISIIDNLNSTGEFLDYQKGSK